MRSGIKNLAALCISAALMAPLGALAMPKPQDDHERHEREEHDRRYYDQQNRDYHNWDSREDRMYRQWLAERNYSYVNYDQLRPEDQRDYWNWRHRQEKRERHEEHEEHEHEHRQ